MRVFLTSGDSSRYEVCSFFWPVCHTVASNISFDLAMIWFWLESRPKNFTWRPVGGVHHGDRDQAWECPRGQFEATPSRELHGQEFEEESGQLLAEAGANATSKGQVVEAALTILASLRAEPVRVKGLHVLEHSWGVVGVTDAVHDTPTFGYLYTLRDGQKGG